MIHTTFRMRGPRLTHRRHAGKGNPPDDRATGHVRHASELRQAAGFIQPPELYHYYGDNFWAELLGPLNRTQYCPALFTEHLNSAVFGQPADATTQAETVRWDQDSLAWNRLSLEKLPELRQRVAAIL